MFLKEKLNHLFLLDIYITGLFAQQLSSTVAYFQFYCSVIRGCVHISCETIHVMISVFQILDFTVDTRMDEVLFQTCSHIYKPFKWVDYLSGE